MFPSIPRCWRSCCGVVTRRTRSRKWPDGICCERCGAPNASPPRYNGLLPGNSMSHRATLPLIFSCLGMTVSGTAVAAAPEVTNDWALDVDRPSDSSPAIAPDGTIYFGTFAGKLWAVNPDGSRNWTFKTGTEIKSSPAVGTDGTIYFGGRDRKFYAVRPDGKKKWEFKTGAGVDSTLAIAA